MQIAAVVKQQKLIRLPDGSLRQKRRVYLRPTAKDIMKAHAQKTAEVLGKEPRDPVRECDVCYKKRPISEMVEVQGGGTQGHPKFWMCPSHL